MSAASGEGERTFHQRSADARAPENGIDGQRAEQEQVGVTAAPGVDRPRRPVSDRAVEFSVDQGDVAQLVDRGDARTEGVDGFRSAVRAEHRVRQTLDVRGVPRSFGRDPDHSRRRVSRVSGRGGPGQPSSSRAPSPPEERDQDGGRLEDRDCGFRSSPFPARLVKKSTSRSTLGPSHAT